MTNKNFISIRHKLIIKITQILLVAFVVILMAVVLFSIRSTSENLSAAELNIRASIVAKGNVLATNNSLALAGMVADNGYTAVRALVSSTVSGNEDIVYGIFMDETLRPWVAANADSDGGEKDLTKSFDDRASLWAHKVTTASHQFIEKKGQQIYEFAAPVVVDGDRAGTIRYGISTKTMFNSLQKVREQSRTNMLQTISTLLIITLVVFMTVYIVVKRLAVFITGPIGDLTESADVIASGNYSKLIRIDSDDEIGLLANNFDRMRNIVKNKINDLNEINTVGEKLALQHRRQDAAHTAFQAFCSHINVISGAMYLVNEDMCLSMEYSYSHDDGCVWVDHPLLDPINGPANFFLKEIDIFVSPNIAMDERLRQYGEPEGPSVALVSVPVFDKENIIGTSLLLCNAEGFSFHTGEYEYFRAIGRLLSISIKNIYMRDVIREQNQNLERKVEERTNSLREKSSDIVNMMKHLNQGLFTIGNLGVIQSEYSLHLTTIFGTEDIAGRDFSELLFSASSVSSDAIDLIKETIALIFRADEMTFLMNQHLLFKAYEKINSHGELRFIELDWNPIYEDDIVEKIMVAVRDVTDLRKLEAETATNKKELQAVGSLLHMDKYRFFQFIKTTRLCVTKTSKIFQSAEQIAIDEWQHVMRDMHTIKGNARTFSFDEITTHVHLMETLVSPLKASVISKGTRSDIFQCLDQLAQAIGFYENIAVYKLEWREDEDFHQPLKINQNILNRGINKLQEIAESETYRSEHSTGNNIEDALDIFRRIAFRPLTEVLQPLLISVPSIARQLGKSKPNLLLDIDGVFISNQSAETIASAFTHILRNSLDHGIETSEERLAKGKPPEGSIKIMAYQEGLDMQLSIHDDGQGLNLAALLKQQSIVDGDKLSDQEIANSIFKSGVSTVRTVTDISGRGIGMNAVKYALQQQGAEINVVLDNREAVHGNRLFKLNISLPETMFCK